MPDSETEIPLVVEGLGERETIEREGHNRHMCIAMIAHMNWTATRKEKKTKKGRGKNERRVGTTNEPGYEWTGSSSEIQLLASKLDARLADTDFFSAWSQERRPVIDILRCALCTSPSSALRRPRRSHHRPDRKPRTLS